MVTEREMPAKLHRMQKENIHYFPFLQWPHPRFKCTHSVKWQPFFSLNPLETCIIRMMPKNKRHSNQSFLRIYGPYAQPCLASVSTFDSCYDASFLTIIGTIWRFVMGRKHSVLFGYWIHTSWVLSFKNSDCFQSGYTSRSLWDPMGSYETILKDLLRTLI